MVVEVALQWVVKPRLPPWLQNKQRLYGSASAPANSICICYGSAWRKNMFEVSVEGLKILDQRASVPFFAVPLKLNHRCCRPSGELSSITNHYLTLRCSSRVFRTFPKPPLPSRRLSGGRKAYRSSTAMASTPKVTILQTLQGRVLSIRPPTVLFLQTAGGNRKVHVLFVCLGESHCSHPSPQSLSMTLLQRLCCVTYPAFCTGNICRSPTAEAVFRTVVERAGLQDQIVIDSCGTGGGNPDW